LREAQARVEAARKRELAATKQAHLEQIEHAQHALETEAREHARAAGTATADARPDPKAQRNFTDPESRIMKTADGFQQCYNAQVAVAVGTQFVVAEDVVTAANDKQQLQPLVEQVLANVDVPDGVIADSGSFSEANVQALEHRDGRPIEAPIAVERDRHGAPPTGPPRGRIPKALSPADRMRRRLSTKGGRAIYAQRKVTVEPAIGQIKGRGLRRFSLRSLIGAKGEFHLVCARAWCSCGNPAPTVNPPMPDLSASRRQDWSESTLQAADTGTLPLAPQSELGRAAVTVISPTRS
jgi:hypothetical protein